MPIDPATTWEAKPAHPDQPILRDKDGELRFKANGIIRRIVDKKMIDLNDIPGWIHRHPGITQDDIDQFWQLMGCEVGHYAELAGSDVISNEAADRAEAAAEKLH